MNDTSIPVRALQLGERIDLKGLEREDTFSTNPLAFRTRAGGTAVLFKSGAAVFINMTPVEEDDLVQSLGLRISAPLAERESEAARLVVKPGEDELIGATGALQLKSADPDRLLLVAQALAMSVSLAYDERRIAQAFDRIGPIAQSLQQRRLPPGPRADLLATDR